MHNLDHFLKKVEDDIATDDDSVTSIPAPAVVAKGKKGKKTAVVEAVDEVAPAAAKKTQAAAKKQGTLNGGVNFVLNDIDNAHSLVSCCVGYYHSFALILTL